MALTHRVERIQEQVREEVSQMLATEVRDPGVGLVTVTSLIGLGGYGVFIREGLRRQFSTEILLGGALSVLLAMVLDLALVLLERILTPWSRHERRRSTRHAARLAEQAAYG